MSREILLVVDVMAREKNVSKEVIFGALELALASATKKRFSEEVEVRVSVDRTSGDFETFRRWQAVPDDAVEFPSRQVALSDAQQQSADFQLDDFVEESQRGNLTAQPAAQSGNSSILAAESDLIRQVLQQHAGNMTQAAKQLGISRATLYRKVQKLK